MNAGMPYIITWIVLCEGKKIGKRMVVLKQHTGHTDARSFPLR
jgi:hypothetical protein